MILQAPMMASQADRTFVDRPGPRIVSSLNEAVPDPQRAMVLVFFSIECPACWEELFEVRWLVSNYSIPIDLVGVTRDRREELEPFLGKFGFQEPVVSDRQRELYRRFRVAGEPFVVILADGAVLYRDHPADGPEERREKTKKCLLEIRDKSLF